MQRIALPSFVPSLASLIVLGSLSPISAQVPLHTRIDQLIAAKKPNFEAVAAPQASDAEFVRRIHLDLIGTIPTVAEVRAFLQDRSPAKREQLIDRLLASPEHARHLQNIFDVMLMERRADKQVPRPKWQEYLRTSFAANKPWDQLVSEILSADGADAKLRPAAKFYLDRDADAHLITRDISRLLLGMNYRCAQCHDHPLVDSYKQAHYYGIYAFLNRSYLFIGKDRSAVLAEKAEGDVSYQSVFDPSKTTRTAVPRMLTRPVVAEPAVEKGKEYSVPPANGVRPVPKFSRRAQLAGQLVHPDNENFRRNVANRLWALMMGRGLVHPVELDHPNNPPSHPELLNALGQEIAAMKFQLRPFLRELALSKTYQRSSELPVNVKDVPPDSYAVAILKPLSPEQFAWSLMQASGITDAQRVALGKNCTEQALHDRLAGNVNPFVNTFGSTPGQPEGQGFEATMDQALFLSNGNLVRGWLAPQQGNLTDRLMKLKDPKAIAEEMYLSILTRLPDDEEQKEFDDVLQKESKNRSAALQELAWALLASAEMRLNH